MKDIELLKKNGIDVDRGIELLGDMEIYEEVLMDFLKEMETRWIKIAEYKNQGDMENYAILVHALKSDSNYLGFTKLAELALNHQLKSQENDLEYVNQNYESLKSEVSRVIEIIEKYFG